MSEHPDEIEEGEIIDSESEMEMEMEPVEDELDVTELMTSLFATEDGDTVCTALVGISNQIQIQNKILVKILAQLQSMKN
jgi:hypothetical protein